MTEQEIRETQEAIRETLPNACRDCNQVDGLGICQRGGCGAQDEE